MEISKIKLDFKNYMKRKLFRTNVIIASTIFVIIFNILGIAVLQSLLLGLFTGFILWGVLCSCLYRTLHNIQSSSRAYQIKQAKCYIKYLKNNGHEDTIKYMEDYYINPKQESVDIIENKNLKYLKMETERKLCGYRLLVAPASLIISNVIVNRLNLESIYMNIMFLLIIIIPLYLWFILENTVLRKNIESSLGLNTRKQLSSRDILKINGFEDLSLEVKLINL